MLGDTMEGNTRDRRPENRLTVELDEFELEDVADSEPADSESVVLMGLLSSSGCIKQY
jgi:hypothetical protein